MYSFLSLSRMRLNKERRMKRQRSQSSATQPLINPVHAHRSRKKDDIPPDEIQFIKRVKSAVRAETTLSQRGACAALLNECRLFGSGLKTMAMADLRREQLPEHAGIKDPLPQVNNVAPCALCTWSCMYNEADPPDWVKDREGFTSNNSWDRSRDMVVLYHAQFPRFMLGMCHPKCAKICLNVAARPEGDGLDAMMEYFAVYMAERKADGDAVVAKRSQEPPAQ